MFGIIPALINMASQHFTNRWNYAATQETNKTNYEINQLNNQFNQAEAQKQRQHELAMWNMNNEYNSPSAQRSRLEAAGLNPYMMMNGGSAGTASSNSGSQAASAAPPLAMQAPRMQAPQFNMPPMSQSLASIGSALNNIGDFRLKMVDSAFRPQLNQAAINELNTRADMNVGNTNWFNASPSAQKYGLDNGGTWSKIRMETNRQGLDNLKYQGTLLQAQHLLTTLDAAAKAISNKYLDAQQQADLAVKVASMFQLFAEGKLSLQKVRTEIANQALIWNQASTEWTRNKILKIDLRARQALVDSYIKAAIQNYGLLADDAKARRKYVDMTAKYEALLKRRTFRSMPVRSTTDIVNSISGIVGAVKGTGINPYTFNGSTSSFSTSKSESWNHSTSESWNHNYNYNGRPNY